MTFKKSLIAVGAAACLVASAQSGMALSPESGQMVQQVYNDLESQGYDVSRFEDLTLSQIALLRTKLEEGGNQTLIRGVLSGACGGSVILDINDLTALVND